MLFHATFKKNEYELWLQAPKYVWKSLNVNHIYSGSLASNSQSFANIHCLVI